MKTKHQVLIIGGGSGGIMTAAYMKRVNPKVDITIIEPSGDHYYQAAWTLVGAGTFNFEDTRRNESSVIPKGVLWIKDFAVKVVPEENKVITKDSGEHIYDFLVVTPGLIMDLDAMPGLREALKTDSVCSNYVDPKHTWEVLKNFKGGNAVFTQPSSPIKCGGAPQKIMYLAEEAFVKSGVRDKTNVIYASPGSSIFGVKAFADTLNEVIKRKKIITRFFYNPVKIDAVQKKIWFKYTKPETSTNNLAADAFIKEKFEEGNLIEMSYDMLHLAPPQKAPDFIRESMLAHQDGPSKGWMNVNIKTLQHALYPNVFGLGDVAALPTAKTGAAIRKQAPVVVENILSLIKHGGTLSREYSGYSSCPLVTGYGKMVLAEFKYDNVRDSDPLLSKFWDTSKEQYSMWILKKYGLPFLYWNMMMKGKMME
ncbi:MAG: NAD(P)/FAD-dependent oxidoreductase [Bacteroidetes bacterium]|nr:NAD(P)/FAD-dependent oxidoreductase [Bacteroidota bacterium]